jgi:hypothetical protein
VKTALDARLPASGTPLSVARYAAGGQPLEASPMTIDANGNVGVRTAAPAGGLHVVTDNVAGVQGDGRLERYANSASGTYWQHYRARGSLAAPARLQLHDISGGDEGLAWGRNAGDTADAWVSLGTLRFAVDSVDAQGRLGGRLNLHLSASASATPTAALTITQAGNVGLTNTASHDALAGTGATRTLVLGPGVAPSSSPPDTVQLTAVDRGGTALKRSLHIRTEDGTSHLLGDLSGIATTLTASLGSGASYKTLNVNGSTLYVGQSSTQERPVALLDNAWATSTDASRKGRLTLSVYDAAAAREGLRLEASGTAPMIGFLGASAVVRQTLPAAATDAATTQTLANSVRTALVNLGLAA